MIIEKAHRTHLEKCHEVAKGGSVEELVIVEDSMPSMQQTSYHVAHSCRHAVCLCVLLHDSIALHS